MRVTIYDKNPGPGFFQWLLKTSWFLGCFLQKLLGKVDKYYGATSWENALTWLALQDGTLSSIQYWGHGSPGNVWLAEKAVHVSSFKVLVDKVTSETVLWFRTCSTFQGQHGQEFSANLSNVLQCTVAGHTRVIGLFQGGLHTRRPQSYPGWTLGDGEFPASFWASNGLIWGDNTITCFATKIPEGW